MKDETFHQILSELKPFLRCYLESNNVEIDDRDFMCCINPNHDDKNPSMHIVPASDDTIVHCFACGASYNIFHAASIFEGLDDRGPGFIKETLPRLAEKYRIDFDPSELILSEEAIVQYRYRQLYKDAFEVLREIGSYNHTSEREWSDETCKLYGVASVDWTEFSTRLCNRGGYTEEELLSKDITNKLFGHHLITFSILDHRGRPCGFVARNVNYDENNKATYPKYRNTNGFVPIYDKSQILYGLQVPAKSPENRLDIFEGYADWITAQDRGYTSCAALGGVALTLEHLNLIKEIGFPHVNIILDGDITGSKKTQTYLDRYAGKVEGLRITVMALPFKENEVEKDSDKDPDNFFKNHSLSEYKEIEPMTAFDWRIKKKAVEIKTKYKDQYSEEELKKNLKTIAAEDLKAIAVDMIPMIMAEPSPIEQGRMCIKLSKITGVSENDIRDEVASRSNKQVKEIGEHVQKKLRYASDAIEIKTILSEGAERLSQATNTKDYLSFNHSEILEHLNSFYDECDEPNKIMTGWKTGWDILDDPVVLGGIPKKDSILTFAGSPNHGKSAFLMNVAKQLLINENKGMTVLLWYLDDPRNIAWAKMLASMTCESILNVRKPERVIYQDIDRKKRFMEWRDYLRHIVASKKFLVKGHDIGNDLNSLEYWIKHVQDSTGNDVVVFVDAVHDMVTGNMSTDGDERIKFARIYDWVQATTEVMEYSFLTCAHITKSGMARGKPEQSDLSETGKIIFSSKVIGIVYSELDYLTSVHKRDNSTMYWIDETEVDNIDKRKPIVEVNITKNKEAQYKGNMFFKHKADACYMEPIDKNTLQKIISANESQDENEDVEVKNIREDIDYTNV
jgi:DNA primase catalytic core